MMVFSWRQLGRLLLPMLLLTIGMLWVPVALLLDIQWFGHGVPELGVTEISQEVLLLASALLWFYLAWRKPEHRGFHLMTGALLICMFIRELDAFFDLIWHGFWKVPVAGVLLMATAQAWSYRQSFPSTTLHILSRLPFAYLLTGGLVVVLFSRLFGTGSFWSVVLDVSFESSNTSLVKNTVQEGLELLGYQLILHGSWLMLRDELEPEALTTAGAAPAAHPRPDAVVPAGWPTPHYSVQQKRRVASVRRS